MSELASLLCLHHPAHPLPTDCARMTLPQMAGMLHAMHAHRKQVDHDRILNEMLGRT